MSKHNDLVLQDMECIKRGSKKLASFANRIAESNLNSDTNRRNKSDDYVLEGDYQNVEYPGTINININIDINIGSSSSSHCYNRESDEYMKAQKRLNWAGGFYMPR